MDRREWLRTAAGAVAAAAVPAVAAASQPQSLWEYDWRQRPLLAETVNLQQPLAVLILEQRLASNPSVYWPHWFCFTVNSSGRIEDRDSVRRLFLRDGSEGMWVTDRSKSPLQQRWLLRESPERLLLLDRKREQILGPAGDSGWE